MPLELARRGRCAGDRRPPGVSVRRVRPRARLQIPLLAQSLIRPVLFRADFLASYLQRAARGAPRCPPPPPGFFLSTGSKTRRHG